MTLAASSVTNLNLVSFVCITNILHGMHVYVHTVNLANHDNNGTYFSNGKCSYKTFSLDLLNIMHDALGRLIYIESVK